MILVRHQESSYRLRNGMVSIPLLAAFVMLAFLEISVSSSDVHWIPLLYIPAVIATAWFLGWQRALVAAGCALMVKLNGGLEPLRLSLFFQHNTVEMAVRLVEYGAIAILTSMLRRSRASAAEIAGRDSLTGLANRKMLMKQAAAEINRSRRTGRPLTLAYLDCDQFKEINDTLGHLAGDGVLRAVAEILASNVRSYDVVARMGGDEFAVLLPDTAPESARAVAERLQRSLRSAMGLHQWPATFSIGAATFVRAPQSAEELISAADQAMYVAKHEQRDSVRYVVCQSVARKPGISDSPLS